FPVFARARENARRASCLSNEKQIGLAVMQYLQDYDERYMHQDETATPPHTWFDSLQPYIKSEQVFRCPSKTPDSSGARSDYLLNGFFAHSVSQATFSNVAEQILAAERADGVGDIDYHPWESGDEFEGAIAPGRHFGG